jgi:hypothetical protein
MEGGEGWRCMGGSGLDIRRVASQEASVGKGGFKRVGWTRRIGVGGGERKKGTTWMADGHLVGTHPGRYVDDHAPPSQPTQARRSRKPRARDKASSLCAVLRGRRPGLSPLESPGQNNHPPLFTLADSTPTEADPDRARKCAGDTRFK